MKIHFQSDDEALVRVAQSVAADLRQAGHTALFAGGCVRDALLARPVKDIDIATSATPDQVEAMFAGKTVAVGKAFGVVVVMRGGFSFDVATFRSDGAYSDGRHPEQVVFATPEGDAQRRDFTVNGLFCEPETNEVIDFVGGLDDLEKRVLCTIGEPEARFREDYLRMLRAVRFSSVLEFELDTATQAAIAAHAEWITKISVERIAMEITRLLCESPRPSRGLNLLRETGLLHHILPEVEVMAGTEQPPEFHPEGDVWTHTCLMLDAVAAPRAPVLAWSLLLHDVGKPPTFCREPDPMLGADRIRFPCHAPIGAELAERILTRLRQPSALVADVKAVVAEHMHFVDVEKMRRAKLRRFMGAATFPVLLEVMRADTQYSNGDFTAWNFLKAAYDSFRSEPVLPEPLVRGRDLVAHGMAPGPRIGELLRQVYDAQLEGHVNTKEEALAWLRGRG